MRFSQFFQEDNGNLSSTRLGYLLWTAGTFAMWAYSSYTHGTLQPLPETVIMGLGILTGGKVVQKFGEKP